MRTLKAIQKAAVVLGGLSLALQTHADTVALQNPATLHTTNPAGFQPPGGSGGPFNLALEFTVNTAVTVTSLGAFDATIGTTGTGFALPVSVGIYSVDENRTVTSVATFVGTQGFVTGSSDPAITSTVIDGSRFISITPVTLTAGDTYMIIAGPMGGTDGNAPLWNYAVDASGPNVGEANPLVFNAPEGEMTLTGNFYQISGTFDTPQDPTAVFNQDTSFQQQYAAGTFTYTAVPEPSIGELGLLGLALLGAVKLGRRFIGTAV